MSGYNTTQHDVAMSEEWARPDWLHYATRIGTPRFENCQQFAEFVGIMIDRWDGAMQATGTAKAMLETMRYGTRIDTHYKRGAFDGPSEFVHLDWIREVLNAAAHGEGDTDGVGREAVRMWAQKDLFGETQTAIAKTKGVSQPSISRRVREARGAVRAALKRRGRLRC
jgi:hypothetical protein